MRANLCERGGEFFHFRMRSPQADSWRTRNWAKPPKSRCLTVIEMKVYLNNFYDVMVTLPGG